MLACPPANVLANLLDDQLCNAVLAEVEEHLASCSACRERVDLLSATPDEAYLQPPVFNPEFEPTSEALGRVVASTLPILAPQTPAIPGDPIPGYEIIAELGRGGMGVVYLSRQVAPNRLVALKLLNSGAFATEEDRARFRREAETAAALSHPNLVPVYELGEYHGTPFFSMEYVAGGSLDRHLTGRPRPVDVAVGLIEIVARAIDHAHNRDVVHRDLKPGNILLSESTDGTGLKKRSDPVGGVKKGSDPVAGTARRVLRTTGSAPFFHPPDGA